MAIDLAAHVAILHRGKILLTQREDVEAWVLPGGMVEEGESVAQAAVREAAEETGVQVELTRLVGIYYWPPAHHSVLFAARPVGGALCGQPGEVIALGYYAPDALPDPLAWWHRQRIADAMAGVGGSAMWRQRVEWPFDRTVTLRMLPEMAAREGLSRQAFFRKYFARPDPPPDDMEVILVPGARIPAEEEPDDR